MPAAQRTVRHLRLQAPGAEQARRLLPVLEDALRCASLGDGEGTRLLVVRRLALGPVAPGITAPTLAQRVEERLAEATRHWVGADSDSAAGAACVAFAGALDARVQLALRRLRGAPCAAWYWPLAVPECAAAMGPADQLQRMAWTIAGWPEARVALPAWAAALAQAGHAVALGRALAPVQGAALLARAGLPPPAAEAARPVAAAAPAPALPAWLEQLLRHTQGMHTAGAAVPPPALADAPPPSDATAPPATCAAAASDAAQDTLPPTAPARPLRADTPQRSPRRTPHAAPAAPPRSASPTAAGPAWRTPTRHGGLLFLLPLLARLGLPDWLAPDDQRFAALVLRAALLRLRAPADDPAWGLAATAAEAAAAPLRPAAPAGWSAGLDRRTTRGAQASTWLAACRLQLRRAGGPPLAGLVRRPAGLALTATHADLFFALDQTDLAVRRLGLDIDPGWLPWFGRVVGFHYGGHAP
ncbi:hypothetical protein [Pseudorhodoferax sp. Leaf265]|uniref:hypothetical protein n=1 Tax=Pseudorhodoferax sp. Leaf265 TaxID=1736315 RepID=UPI0006F86273|nr:hypothetical protein [Pseudorhodoferax sp. Leaf265]KQP04472.1 hypothetical protein ASF45_14140 [Pseudorhodoferax sp. Leaf265]